VPDMLRFLANLVIPEDIPVYVGAMQSGYTSWNHSKLIIVDGERAICGGHNLWTGTYCEYAPVQDISVQLQGPAVAVAQRFLDKQWSVIARYSRTKKLGKWYWSRMQVDGKIYKNALASIRSMQPDPVGKTPVLALARMGAQLVPNSRSANASRTARIIAARLAKREIRLSQQMLGGGAAGHIDEEFFDVLCRHVADGKRLYIIISDKGATNGSGVPYSGYGVKQTAELIGTEVARMTGLAGKELADFLAERVHIGPVRIYDRQPGDPQEESWKWRKPRRIKEKITEPANHAKVYIIDDEAFYVGSDNAYAAPYNEQGLQEFGFMISGKEETRRFMDGYWDKFWRYSSQFKYQDWPSFVTSNQGETA
jgi:phosphatidylserine/phosphatidylglycerophosphate/cardiolipin synthase-like enzyme